MARWGTFIRGASGDAVSEDEPVQITRWTYVAAGEPHVPFRAVSKLIAEALWPDDETSEQKAFEAGFKQAAARDNLDAELHEAVKNGELEALDPLTLGRHRLAVGSALDDALISVSALRAFIAPRGVGVRYSQHFVTSVRPLRVPPDLLDIEPGAFITFEDRIGSDGKGRCKASEYRERIEETMSRQAEGLFTVDEAGQVLADARGLDPGEMVRRMRDAHAQGKLPIRAAGSRLLKSTRETARDFLDLVKVSDVDAWLKASGAGYGFPPPPRPELVPEPAPGLQAVMSNAITTVGAPRATWQLGLEALLPGLERQLGRTAKVREVIKHLKANGAAYRIEPEGGPDQLFWRTGMEDRKLIEKKTISNAVSDWRKNRSPA